MKAVVTGASGAVGTALANKLKAKGHSVVAWDRSSVPIDNYQAMLDFLRDIQPNALFHLAIASRPTGRFENESWLVNFEWPSELAWIAKQLSFKFVFTSTVMVFTEEAPGPYTLKSRPNAVEGYGGDKRWAEERVFYQNPAATVARLGWQIGEEPGSNNMIDWLDRQMEEHGEVRASRLWFPACSLLADTAGALIRLADEATEPGLYQLDSNRGWNFCQIVQALNDKHGGDRWKLAETDEFEHDQRMIDPRGLMPGLNERLPSLAPAIG